MEPNQPIELFVIGTIAGICGSQVSEITLATHVSELALDSLRMTALAAHIESAHECRFGTDDLLELLEAPRVADIVTISRKVMSRPNFVGP
jgi:acyl carrier protein